MLSAFGSLWKPCRITQRFEAKPPWTEILNIKGFIFLGPSLWETTTQYFLPQSVLFWESVTSLGCFVGNRSKKRNQLPTVQKYNFHKWKSSCFSFPSLKKEGIVGLLILSLCFLWFPLSFSRLKAIVPSLKCLEGGNVKVSNILFPSSSDTISFLFSKQFKVLTRNQLHIFKCIKYWEMVVVFLFFFPASRYQQVLHEIIWTASTLKNTKTQGSGTTEHGFSVMVWAWCKSRVP